MAVCVPCIPHSWNFDLLNKTTERGKISAQTNADYNSEAVHHHTYIQCDWNNNKCSESTSLCIDARDLSSIPLFVVKEFWLNHNVLSL